MALVPVHLALSLMVALPVEGRIVVLALSLVDFPRMVGTHQLLLLTEILLVPVVEFLRVHVALGHGVLGTSGLHLSASLVLYRSHRHHLHHLNLLLLLFSRVL